ncbi:MAG: Uma2 family endonuclease, partial [Cyanobacteria bacterium P01_H01_bin.130]
MPITCDRLIIEPGNTVSIRADWDEFNALLEELGDRRETRIAYRDGTINLTLISRKHRHSEEVVIDFIHSLFSELEMAFSVCS